MQVKTTLTPGVTVTLMLCQYLEMLHLEKTKNPLEFWNQHKQTFPELYNLVIYSSNIGSARTLVLEK